MPTATAGLGALITRAAKFTSYGTYTYNTNRNIPGVQGRMTVAEATELVRAHVAADSRLRSTEVANHGAVTLHRGDTHVRLEPGLDARPRLLTQTQAEDLLRIADTQSEARLIEEPKGWTVQGGVWRIPPGATEGLIRRGWIATDGTDRAPVVVSLAGLVALHWRYLKAEGAPAGRFGEEIAEALVDVLSS